MEQSYSVREVAKIMGVHFNTILNMIKRDEVKAYKFGRQWRITESEVARLQNGGR